MGPDAMTADPEEIAKFEAMAAEWWDPEGKFKPLHMMNPVRLDYIVSQITAEYGRNPQSLRPLDGLRVADVGCGGGLLSEPMARLGAEVVGIDASEGTLPVARLHAKEMGLEIDYRHTTAEALAGAGETFDAVLAMEIVEHVPDPASFLAACARLVRPGGLLILSTISRTAKSYAVAIVGAERIMRWLPPGTHDWSKLITADELQQLVRDAGMEPVDAVGFVFDPVRWDWRTDPRDLSVNYAVTAVKTA